MSSTISPAPADFREPDMEHMQCLEVWGGNRGVERHFHLPGMDVWLYSRPHKNVASGGDVYYLSSCASGRISRLLLADVSGHGLAVAQCAIRLRELMRRHINRVNQSRFVAELNEEFANVTHDDVFATAIVGTFFATTRSLQLCTAGHPYPLIYRRDAETWEVLQPAGLSGAGLKDAPLGIADGVEYSESLVNLAVGDMLLAYSDGVTESATADHELLGTDGLLKLARSLDSVLPGEFLPCLLGRLREQVSSNEGDDLTLLLARADGTGATLRDTLLAPFRLIRAARDSTGSREA